MNLRHRINDTVRSGPVKVGDDYSYSINSGKKTLITSKYLNLAQGVYEECMDENHGRPPYHTGGPFFLLRDYRSADLVASADIKPVGVVNSTTKRGYVGAFVLNKWPSLAALGTIPSSYNDYSSPLNPDDLSGAGNVAYNKLRPKVAKVGLAQTLLEMRDLPRTLKTTAGGLATLWTALGGNARGARMKLGLRPPPSTGREAAKDLADHYINHEFGWRPLLKDLTDLYNLIDRYHTTVSAMKRSNGKWAKRSFAEPEILSDVIVHDSNYLKSHTLYRAALLPSLAVESRASMSVHRIKSTRVWYEGRFRIYRPEFDDDVQMNDQVRSARQFLALAGLNANPVTLYKVTPWTWLADWFGNFGGQLQALQDWANGETASKYMYIMREIIDSYVYTGVQWYNTGDAVSGTTSTYRVVKRRSSASSPFGFSLTGDLSPRQLAILGALGISRFP